MTFVTFELRIMGRSAGKWDFLLYDINGASASISQVNLLQDDTKFIVVAIVSNTVGWTMVNMMMMMLMNKSQFIVNNQCWAGGANCCLVCDLILTVAGDNEEGCTEADSIFCVPL